MFKLKPIVGTFLFALYIASETAAAGPGGSRLTDLPSSPELILKPSASVTCEETLLGVREAFSKTFSGLIIGEPIVMQIGIYKDIRKLTIASGLDRSTANQSIALISRILEAGKGRETVIGSTFSYLQRHQNDQRSLLVCVLEGTCHMPVGTMFIPDESKIALDNVLRSRVRIPLDRPIPHLIIMNGGAFPYAGEGIPGPPQAVAVAWAIDFLTSATSFANYELISDWIQANSDLLQARQRSDELFDRYARIVPKLKIDLGFFRVLASARASSASFSVVPLHQQQLREKAMEEIRDAWSETKEVATRFNLSNDNILEFGERATKQMLETIRRAAALPKQ